MTDELRDLLAVRAGTVEDNPARVAEVRSRIRAIRRRRVAGTALAVVAIVLAGVVLTRLPGRPEPLPTGVPAGPWFQPNGSVSLPGFEPVSGPAAREFNGPTDEPFLVDPVEPLRYLVLTRCRQRGTLAVSPVGGGRTWTVHCSRRAGAWYEGVLELTGPQAQTLFAGPPGGENVRLVPSSGGTWGFLLAESRVADTLVPWRSADRPLLDGGRDPSGGTVEVTLPRWSGTDAVAMTVSVDCTTGIRLAVDVPAGRLADVDCDPLAAPPNLQEYRGGRLTLWISPERLSALRLRPAQRVTLTVRSVRAATGRWRLDSVG